MDNLDDRLAGWKHRIKKLEKHWTRQQEEFDNLYFTINMTFELIDELIWMMNVDSTCNVQRLLKQLEKLKKRVIKK